MKMFTIAVMSVVASLLPSQSWAQAPTDLVTGSALISFTLGGEQHWQFSAKQDPDGSASGQLQLVTSQANGGKVHGAIFCVSSDPDTGIARLAALIDRSTTPLAPAGSYVIWTVKDNGPGADDATSDLVPTNAFSAALHCSVGFNLLMLDSQRGQIEVHK